MIQPQFHICDAELNVPVARHDDVIGQNEACPEFENQSNLRPDTIMALIDEAVLKLQKIKVEMKAALVNHAPENINSISLALSSNNFVTYNRRCDEKIRSLVKNFYSDRRKRVKFVPGADSIFGEPAWDILLDLYDSELSGKRVSITSACLGASIPTTTGLRWLAELECRQMIVREIDPKDKRRTFIKLTESAISQMRNYFVDCLK